MSLGSHYDTAAARRGLARLITDIVTATDPDAFDRVPDHHCGAATTHRR